MLIGCAHEHEWMNAICTNPKTCLSCRETEGSELEHHWMEATCVNPKKCSKCAITEGLPLPHS